MSTPNETGQAPQPFAAADSSAIVDLPASVVYRTGRPDLWDYAEAISALNDAAKQLRPDGAACAVCGDSGHQAWECHHNPLVMARRGARKGREWRCFHCGLVFYDPISAEEHFGTQGTPKQAKCQQESAKDWVGDFSHENGQYLNRCSRCASTFRGHKRRWLCKQCWDASGAYEMPDGPGE